MTDVSDVFMSKAFGYDDMDEYHKENSCIHYLKDIKVPFFQLNTRDDPIIHHSVLERFDVASNPNLLLGTTKCGGHIGYLTSDLGGIRQWFTDPVFEYFNAIKNHIES